MQYAGLGVAARGTSVVDMNNSRYYVRLKAHR